jgi:hypothetical protein
MRLAAHACECPDCGSIHHCVEREIPFDPDGSISYFFSVAEKTAAPGWTVHKADLEYLLSDDEMKQVMDVLAGDPGLGLSEQARYAGFDPSVHARAWREKGDITVRFE